jgi:hypothetical protein
LRKQQAGIAASLFFQKHTILGVYDII